LQLYSATTQSGKEHTLDVVSGFNPCQNTLNLHGYCKSGSFEQPCLNMCIVQWITVSLKVMSRLSSLTGLLQLLMQLFNEGIIKSLKGSSLERASWFPQKVSPFELEEGQIAGMYTSSAHQSP